jgi:hypothetical protein
VLGLGDASQLTIELFGDAQIDSHTEWYQFGTTLTERFCDVGCARHS